MVVCQAVSALFPSTPHSSWGLSERVVSLERALVSFTSPPPWLQLAGRSGMAVAGVWGSASHWSSEAADGAAGQGNCPVWVAVPEPVLGSSGPPGTMPDGCPPSRTRWVGWPWAASTGWRGAGAPGPPADGGEAAAGPPDGHGQPGGDHQGQGPETAGHRMVLRVMACRRRCDPTLWLESIGPPNARPLTLAETL